VDAPPVALRPYFVALGTIEPRKNHLLLLNLWRQFAPASGPAAPRLVVVGRRGWENENVLDMLERCSAIDGLVRETGPLPDLRSRPCCAARAPCCSPPSRKASACRWPRRWRSASGLASDLPALRRSGRGVPDTSTRGRAAWRAPCSTMPARQRGARAQMARLAHWRRPSGRSIFAVVDRLLDRAAAGCRAAAQPGPQPRRRAGAPSRPRRRRSGAR
jgi:hypothetical protein